VYLYKAAAPAVSSDYYARGSTRIVLRPDAAGRDGLPCAAEVTLCLTGSAPVASSYWSFSCCSWRGDC